MMNGSEEYKEYEDFELQKPDYIRQRLINDLIKHANDNKKAITKELFRKHGVPDFMINYTYKNRYEDLKMMNEKIINDLKQELAQYKRQIAGYKKSSSRRVHTTYQVREDNDNYYYRILKNSKVKEQHIIPKKNVELLKKVFKHLQKNNDTKVFSYRQVVNYLILTHQLDIDIDAFNGGTNRKYYFKIYYYPVKILEQQRFLKQKTRKLEVL